MTPKVVHAHIGSSKTGTTFIQQALWANKAALDSNHILVPGDRRRQQGDAARALNRWSSGDPTPEAWRTIADEIVSSSHPVSLLSQEFLCWLDAEQIQQFVGRLRRSDVKVVLTTRDLARLIPAQWQSALRQGRTWTLTEYSNAVAGLEPRGNRHPAYVHFWKRQDYGGIVRRWMDAIGRDNVTVVTLPRSGSDPDELWRRFCASIELDADRYPTKGVRNTSLGAASAEVLRRLNGTDAIEGLERNDYAREVNGRLTRHVLDPRRPKEPGLTLPTGQRDWVVGKSEQIIAELEASGVKVIGSLDELRSEVDAKPYVAPEETSDDELLAAAMDALAGYAVEHGERRADFESKKKVKAQSERTERRAARAAEAAQSPGGQRRKNAGRRKGK
ncbi:MAG: hypothetical protein ACJ73J_08305 [Actinomycetes bacterium]